MPTYNDDGWVFEIPDDIVIDLRQIGVKPEEVIAIIKKNARMLRPTVYGTAKNGKSLAIEMYPDQKGRKVDVRSVEANVFRF